PRVAATGPTSSIEPTEHPAPGRHRVRPGQRFVRASRCRCQPVRHSHHRLHHRLASGFTQPAAKLAPHDGAYGAVHSEVVDQRQHPNQWLTNTNGPSFGVSTAHLRTSNASFRISISPGRTRSRWHRHAEGAAVADDDVTVGRN